jgi:hypothetical protein
MKPFRIYGGILPPLMVIVNTLLLTTPHYMQVFWQCFWSVCSLVAFAVWCRRD